MRNVWTLYHKEMLEALRSYRLIWVPAVFIILGVMQPLTTYYMPEILAASGNLPPGMLEGYEMPGAAVVMAQALGQYGILGMLILVLGVMNSLAGERSSGTIEMLMVKPLTPAAIVSAKWAAQLTLLILALGSGAAGAAYYTEQLIGPLSWSSLLAAAGLYGLWLLCAVSLTLLFSAWLRGPSAAILGLLAAAAMSLAQGLLPGPLAWTPAALTALSADIMTEGGGLAKGPILSAAALIILCLAGASVLIRRNKLPD
ncbi:ABC transporter permease subunit [Paenibacillus sp. S150]|uniref:ABC transporter permease subunit n=1 Tax=Paenibacillus sp. S150 TaxID=2749826 RepID=UPI001C589C6E|nr:ABC transporter permease subunit [Paenibacillus sp. S150]MBW4083785.1 ABC transporter permease subunit [Paenibacillus sp. S150]